MHDYVSFPIDILVASVFNLHFYSKKFVQVSKPSFNIRQLVGTTTINHPTKLFLGSVDSCDNKEIYGLIFIIDLFSCTNLSQILLSRLDPLFAHSFYVTPLLASSTQHIWSPITICKGMSKLLTVKAWREVLLLRCLPFVSAFFVIESKVCSF